MTEPPETNLKPPTQIIGPVGVASAFASGTPGLKQQREFLEARHSLPDAPVEVKHEFRRLAHAAILAVTHSSSVPSGQVDDWLDRLRLEDYRIDTMEQILVASADHVRSLGADELAVGNSQRARRFEAFAARFDRLLNQIKAPAPIVPMDRGAHGKPLSDGDTSGNIELLRDVRGNLHEFVTYATAGEYLNCGLRQIQKLVKACTLELIGAGLNKRIRVASLFKYCPPKEKAN
jgi:hypothetical protein